MSKVKIFTDSAADLPQEMLTRYDIGMVSILISFPEKSYADGVDLTAGEFYRLMDQAPRLPVTSQPSPLDFVQGFQPHLAAGAEIVSINLSSGLSGTVESALLAKESLEELGALVHIVDSRSASMGQGLLVLLAAELAEQGQTAAQIVEAVEAARGQLQHLFTLDTTENLVKGGRISRAKGALGDLLNIKPLLYLDDAGKIEMLDKVRGRKKSLKYLLDSYSEQATTERYRFVGISHADCQPEAEEVAAKLQALHPEAEVVLGTIGATIGTHVARGCIAIFYFSTIT